MKEFFRIVLTWVLGLFNLQAYAGDDLDSLIMNITNLELDLQAKKLSQTYDLILIVESFKCFLMIVSILFLILAHYPTIKQIGSWIWTKSKHAINAAKNYSKNLFKPKH